MKQQTLAHNILLEGRDPYGGSLSRGFLQPAPEHTGILFQTEKGDLPARLEYAFPFKHSILLHKDRAKVLCPEHLLATLFAYGVDNCIVRLQREPSRSLRLLQTFGLGTDIDVVPLLPDREKTLCEKLEEVGLESQAASRTYIYPSFCGDDKLTFEPRTSGFAMRATTAYSIPGEQSVEYEITPHLYHQELATSRPLVQVPSWLPPSVASFLAALFNPRFGFSHGFSHQTVFYPHPDPLEWQTVTKHTFVDRLGAIALLPGRLDRAYVTIRFSNHVHDLHFLKMNQEKFRPSKK